MSDDPQSTDDDGPASRSPDNGSDGEEHFNDALKQGLRRAGMHWMRAGYELLAGVGAFLDELNQKRDDDEIERHSTTGVERIDLE